jgi:hypothetical protein
MLVWPPLQGQQQTSSLTFIPIEGAGPTMATRSTIPTSGR